MEREMYIPATGLVVAELMMLHGNLSAGLGIHLINILIIIFIIIFRNLSLVKKSVLQGIALLILLRMINFSTPPFFTNKLLQYLLIYGIIFVPIYLTIRNQNISNKDLGIKFSRLYIYIPISIIIGILAAIIEYRIIGSAPLIYNFNFSNLLFLSIIMFAFMGIVEEIIFRSIVQTSLEKLCGLKYGLFLTGGIFGIMHIEYGVLNEIIFAIIFGIILGYIFQKTRNIFFTTSIHGTANTILFGFGLLPNGLMVVTNSHSLSANIILTGEELTSIFLIIVLSISFLISDSKYSDKLGILGIYMYPLFLTFITMVVYKIMIIL